LEKKALKIGLGVLFAIVAIALLSQTGSAAQVNNTDDTITHGSPTTVVLGTTYGDNCVWENGFDGYYGWGYETFVLNWPGGWLEIQCYDRFWYGDFYSVNIVDTATGTIKSVVFTTPEVETDYHHSCTGYPWSSYHTGLGSTYSDGTYRICLEPGTYEFMVKDELFPQLFVEGGRTEIDTWSPAGYYIVFRLPTTPIPEVPLGTVMAGAAMLFACLAFAGVKPLKMFRRRL
jgi:hypothetical protein